MDTVVNILFEIAAILIVFDIFEFTKALASTLQGDRVPKNTGGLTLNPFKHFEPIGFILMFFMSFGWAKPVETSQYAYKDKQRGNLITYFTPIAVALILSYVLKLVMGFVIIFIPDAIWTDYLNLFIAYIRKYFIITAVINLIPVYPFCGSRILRCFLSPNAQIRYSQSEKLYQMVLMFLLLFGVLSPVTDYFVRFFF